MIIYLEANIGAGKSTLLDKLKKSDLDVEIIQEPVNDWLNLKDKNGKNILDCFYSDLKKWSFAFQINAFHTRIKKMENCNKDTVYIIERSIYSDKNCFAKNCLNNNIMNEIEWKIYSDMHAWAQKYILKPDGFIYLNTSPEVCMRRISVRNRKEENTISMDYLVELDKLHNEFFDKIEKKIILNGDIDFGNNDWLPNIIIKIKNFIDKDIRK